MRTAQHKISYLKTGSLFAAFLGVFARLFAAPQVISLYACILIFALLPLVAQATLDCTVKSVQLMRGHANTYLVPPDGFAIGDFVGTENTFDIIYRCKVSGTPTQWGIAERNVTTVTDTGLLAQWNAIDAYPVLTTSQLQ